MGAGIKGREDSRNGRRLFGLYYLILVTKCPDIPYRRPLERPFRRSRPNCLAAKRSLQRLSIISSGQLLRYMQVGLATLPSDENPHILTECVGRLLVPLLAPTGGSDTVRLFLLASRVYDY